MILSFNVFLIRNEHQQKKLDCPNIISRQEWGARPSANPLVSINKVVNHTIIHHGASSHCETKEACMRIVRSFQDLHLDDRKWDDIGYNFIVGEDGNVYEGRGWNKVGAHSPQFNRDSIGICLIGNFMNQKPKKIALDAIKSIIECSVELGFVKQDYILKGHRDQINFGGTATLCPGEYLYEEIQTWPHFG